MLRSTSASSRVLRVCVLGLATITAAVIFTSDTADARRAHRHRHNSHHRHVRHHEARQSYNPAYSSIIVDANSGATLQSTSPDGLRFPASLTKVMTLYLLFERLESGKMSLDTEMNVSEHASEQAPTKLGLRPGQTIRVEDAIKGLVTRSANDAAVVIAEAIGGDEDDFAKMMTRKARALGMTRTVYRNASGLPNDDQVTTARDQSILGRSIQDRFPRYYRYFATASFKYRGHNIRNHNHLLGSVEGVDGIKTGYTRASGFNLITNLRRGNRHLVGVVMGGRSARSRDGVMRNLLAENLDKATGRRTVAAITERSPAEANAAVAEANAAERPAAPTQVQGAIQVAAASVERRAARRDGAASGAGAADAWTCGAERAGVSDVSATSAAASEPLRSVTAATVWVVAALSRFSASRLRMMASREPPLRPPSTTPIRWRLPRRIEVTRLKPEARV
jgi:D-alanyl-D-alanine carboxypeptidase